MKKSFQKVLVKIAKELNKNNIDWVLIGTTNHLLQGIKGDPNDIDILVKLKDLENIQKIFSNYNLLSSKAKLGYPNLKFKVNNIPVEIIAQENIKKYFKNKKKFINNKKVEDILVPCRSLKEELKLYIKLKRKEKVRRIRKKINL